jgi:hypothetical protein
MQFRAQRSLFFILPTFLDAFSRGNGAISVHN